jgi:hypothetical protein
MATAPRKNRVWRASRSKGRRIEEHAKRSDLAICQWFGERKTAATSARMLFRGHAQSTCASCKPIRSSFHERMGILALGHDLENLLPFWNEESSIPAKFSLNLRRKLPGRNNAARNTRGSLLLR